jgi:hypothetical protein
MIFAGRASMRFIKEDRHPEIPSMRARCLQRPNRGEGPFVSAGKHKVSQGYSPADENAGLAYALRDDVCKWFE